MKHAVLSGQQKNMLEFKQLKYACVKSRYSPSSFLLAVYNDLFCAVGIYLKILVKTIDGVICKCLLARKLDLRMFLVSSFSALNNGLTV